MENTTIYQEEIQLLKQELEEEKRRPKIGIGICCYNEDGKILVGRRINSKIGTCQFPGGHLEYGETFEECSVRELAEETGIQTEPHQYKYITTLNVRKPEHNFHNVGIIMSVKVDKDVEFQNLEPHKNEGWEWMAWEDFTKRDDLFCPMYLLFEQGYTKIEQFY
ncbi:unnamed protein product [Moneuplotes crassus]|uniref:Nudix hydrolase domain-containing protein n=1 Tax=Euplotes crassus TaxID=5936 RepID=A0AAD1Y2Y6_EUPCR|nr:unnamed protein product [Moneuplotes crassus]